MYMYLQPQKTRSRTGSGRQSKVYPLYHIMRKQNPVLENVRILNNMYLPKKLLIRSPPACWNIFVMCVMMNKQDNSQVPCVQVLHPLIGL